MSKRTVFTTITPLPQGITRETVLETLHNHFEMIDLNPLVIERHPIKAPRKASPEEYHSIWYHVVDKINYFPGYQGRTEFDVCFHDLNNGLQTHCFAPLGLDIKDKWTIGGTLPHEPKEPVELGLGVPKDGLWLREDVDMKCNLMATGFVKKTLKKAHATLVERLVEKAHIRESEIHNSRLEEHNSIMSYYSEPKSPAFRASLPSPDPAQQHPAGISPYPDQRPPYRPIEHRYSLETTPYPYSPPLGDLQQPPADSRYPEPPINSRYSQPPPDPRYAQSATQVQDPMHSHQPYQPHRPVELAPTEFKIAELPTSELRNG
ncbi:MAG: hypothetical protein Q9207_004625 [Kuettlingeria erythrocarpa]